jgi:site-specific DNA-adenine methylase
MLSEMGFPGGKGRLYARIIGLMPPHSVYIEPFAGSAVVARHKKPAARTILVDRDDRLISRARIWAPRAWQLQCADAVSVLSALEFDGDELIYCDPPYPRLTRRNRRAIYRHEMSDREHLKLLTLLRRLKCKVMVSSYPSALYAKALAGWRLLRYRVSTRAGRAVECVWCNFDEPRVLHDERFIGPTFRQRQDVRRRLLRLQARIARLTSPEQAVLHSWLSEMQNKESA